MRGWIAVAAVLCGLGVVASPARADDEWHAAWGTAMQGPYPKGALTVDAPLLGGEAVNQSFRMIARLTTGGTHVRVRLSNALGRGPVTFDGARVAHRLRRAAVDPATDRPLTFGGAPSVTVPAGQTAVSDPVALDTAAGQDLAVSFHVAGRSSGVTFHSFAWSTSYLSGAFAGDIGADHEGLGFGFSTLSWFFVDRIDVSGGPATSTVVAFGDSLTDGGFTDNDSHETYPELLAARLGPGFGVVNAGISGNSISRVRNARNDPAAGPPGIDRFERDALEAPGVDTVLLLEGTNDLSVDAGPDTVQKALAHVAQRARERGVCVIGMTLTPRTDGQVPYGWNATRNEPERIAVNGWIRSGVPPFTAVADTDRALRDPANHRRLRPEYDNGDHLHLNTAGRQAIVSALPLDVIRRCAQERRCTPRASATITLPAGLRRIRVDGRRVPRGTRRVRVDLRGRTGNATRIRVRGRRADGRRYARTRVVRLQRCYAGTGSAAGASASSGRR